MKPKISKKAIKFKRSISPVRQIMSYADTNYVKSIGINPEDLISFAGGWVNHKAPKELQKAYEKITVNNELFHNIAKSIYKNKIVGYFNDKMEFGARALGNRSILANPCSPKIKEIINKKIKKRESFRPFAPAIIIERKKDWFNNSVNNPYMSAVELIIKKKQKNIPAVTHVDGTGRVQTVSKKLNMNFYSIIKKFEKLSGVPIILNTSFNENEPIVMDFKDAINCFLRTKMDILVLNNIVIKR